MTYKSTSLILAPLSPLDITANPMLSALASLVGTPPRIHRADFKTSTDWERYRKQITRQLAEFRILFKTAFLAGVRDSEIRKTYKNTLLSWSGKSWHVSATDTLTTRKSASECLQMALECKLGESA